MKREGTAARRVSALRRAVASSLVAVVVMLAAGVSGAAAAQDTPNSLGLRATYNVTATLKWAKKRLFVTSTATVTNTTDQSVDALTFNAVPAAIGQVVLGAVTAGPDVDNQVAASTTVDDQSIIVALPASLDPGQQTVVTINYKATFGIYASNKGFLFEKVNAIATAYRWIPWLSVDYPFATPTFGEPFVTATSDEVDVTFTSDRALVYATSGVQTAASEDGLTQSFVAHNVRDFNFSASPNYQTRTGTWNGIDITWYFINLNPDKMQKWTNVALDHYSSKVGPYAWNHLSVAEIGTFLGMESPGMVWISSTHPSLLKYLVVHELAHEWFYAAVGNDQAMQPFADEAMAEFLTRDLLGFRASDCADQNLDGSTYDYTKECYYEVIYVQGADYLNDYRQRMGADAFWAGIESYYNDYSSKIGGTKELLDELDAAAGSNVEDHSDRFPSLYPAGG